jgi:hypothetical protein
VFRHGRPVTIGRDVNPNKLEMFREEMALLQAQSQTICFSHI